MGGDIAKQMPVEAKKFVKIDKDWNKTMLKGTFIVAIAATLTAMLAVNSACCPTPRPSFSVTTY